MQGKRAHESLSHAEVAPQEVHRTLTADRSTQLAGMAGGSLNPDFTDTAAINVGVGGEISCHKSYQVDVLVVPKSVRGPCQIAEPA